MENQSAINRNEIMKFADKWIVSETIILHEVTEPQKDKYHTLFLIHGCYL